MPIMALLVALIFVGAVVHAWSMPLGVSLIAAGVGGLVVLIWREGRPAVREAPAWIVPLGFRRPRKRFLGREYDAGEPARATVRGYVVSLDPRERPVGPADSDMTLHVWTQLRRPAASALEPWLERHPALRERLQAADADARWRLAPDARELGFVWGDPRAVEWSTPRLQACVHALVDLAEALDAASHDAGAR